MTQKTPSNVYPIEMEEDLISVEDRIKRFSSLLDDIENLSDKKKELWRQIYGNAVRDRNNALLCYNDLFQSVLGKPIEHAVHAANLSKYIERMSRANDQLIKLAELLAEAEEKSEELNIEEIYDQKSYRR